MLTFALIVGFIVAWTVLYFLVIRPKLVAFRYTAGIYKDLDAFELSFTSKMALWLKGLKVAIVGLVTSSAPVLAVSYDKIAGFDWSTFLPTERAKIVAGVVAFMGVLGPLVMVWMHSGAMADASAQTPVDTPPK